MLTSAWTPLRWHAEQTKLWRTRARFVGVVAGRGSGKTELARRRIVRYLPVRKPYSNPIYLYAMPTYNQARRVAWGALRSLIPESWLVKANNSSMLVETVFGSSLYVMGMDKPQRAEGVQWDGVVLDESSDQKPGTFARSLFPAMSHRRAWCWRIGVPKRFGVGADEFRTFWDECRRRELEGDPNWEAYWWPSDEIVPAEELDIARRTLDERDFEEQYRASWQMAAGRMFYAFDDVMNVRDDIALSSDLPIYVGSDFNVDPMAWTISQVKLDPKTKTPMLHVLDEVWRRNTNTPETLEYLVQKYGDHHAGFSFFGDATGRARKSSASMSDYVLIKNHSFFSKCSRVFYPKANPLVVNRVAACNAMFKNAEGVRRCLVHPRCRNLIRDLKMRQWKPGTREPDDSGDIGHISDALGYEIHYLFPARYEPAKHVPQVQLARN